MLKLLGWEIQTIMINILMVLMDKVNTLQELMGSIGRELEILRKNQKGGYIPKY